MKVGSCMIHKVSSKSSRHIGSGLSKEVGQPDGMAWVLEKTKERKLNYKTYIYRQHLFTLKYNSIHTSTPFFHDGRAKFEFPALKIDWLLWKKKKTAKY